MLTFPPNFMNLATLVFWRVLSRMFKIIICCRVLVSNSGLELELVKFYRLELQLSTLTNSNYGVDSDSAALMVITYFAACSAD